tara:strand:- start:3249 stop:4535 length:1287 start_codon:yes stop_codon:yes gene_type:complete
MKARYWFLTGILTLLVSFAPVLAATGTQEIDDFTRPNQAGWGTASGGDVVWGGISGATSGTLSSNRGECSGRGDNCYVQNQANHLGNITVTQLTYNLFIGNACSGGSPWGGCDQTYSFWDNSTGAPQLITTWTTLNSQDHYYGTWGTPVLFASGIPSGSPRDWEIDFDVALQTISITDVASATTSGAVPAEFPFTDVNLITFNKEHPASSGASNNGDFSLGNIEMEYTIPVTPPAGGGNVSPGGGCPAGFGCSLEFNNTNGQWIYTWNDTLNSMQSTELKVYGYLGNAYASVGTNTSTDFAGTIYIDTYLTYENSTTRAFSYLTDTNRTWPGAATTAMILSASHYATPVINHSVFGPNLVIDQPEGVFWAIIIIGTMVMMTFANPAASIVMMLVGLFASANLGLFALNPGTLMLLALLGFISIVRLSK